MPPFASYPSLKGRSVFVSGGGSGIGASIVEHFAEQGAKVSFVDIDEAASKALSKKIAGAAPPSPECAGSCAPPAPSLASRASGSFAGRKDRQDAGADGANRAGAKSNHQVAGPGDAGHTRRQILQLRRRRRAHEAEVRNDCHSARPHRGPE